MTVTAKERPEVGLHVRPNGGSATGWCNYWFTTSILRPRIVRARKTCAPLLLRAGEASSVPRLLPATHSCPPRPEPMRRPQQLRILRSWSDSGYEVPGTGAPHLLLLPLPSYPCSAAPPKARRASACGDGAGFVPVGMCESCMIKAWFELSRYGPFHRVPRIVKSFELPHDH